MYLLVGLVSSKCGCQCSVPHAVRGTGPSRVICDQMFCAAVDVCVTVARLDVVVRTILIL